jgi:hypothetical protein
MAAPLVPNGLPSILHIRSCSSKAVRRGNLSEIDLVVERPAKEPALVEIKSGGRVDERDTGPLERLARDFPNSVPFVISRDPASKVIGGVRAVPWREGLRLLGLL